MSGSSLKSNILRLIEKYPHTIGGLYADVNVPDDIPRAERAIINNIYIGIRDGVIEGQGLCDINPDDDDARVFVERGIKILDRLVAKNDKI